LDIARGGPFRKTVAGEEDLFFALGNFSLQAQILLGETIAVAARSNGRGISPTGSAKMSTLLMIILLLLIVGSLPTWPYSSGWGYYPAGGLGVVLLVALVLLLFRGRTV
jgi:Protein of unknown function (DUF3309)